MTNLDDSKTNWEDITENGGIKIIFSGKNNARRIARKVKPHVLKKIAELSVGLKRTKNLVIEGDNLKVMATLYQYHGKVDLI
jgi:adenine-specific DNA-methyltransferase